MKPKNTKRKRLIRLALLLLAAAVVVRYVTISDPWDRASFGQTVLSLLILAGGLAMVISFMRAWGARREEYEEGELDEAKQLDKRLRSAGRHP